MKNDLVCNVVNVLYYLYFENRELVYHFERIWTEDGMSYEDEEYSYVFCGMANSRFPTELETYYFLHENNIIEETGGNEHERICMLTPYYRTALTTILKERHKESRQIP